jgi:hypothetical protein
MKEHAERVEQTDRAGILDAPMANGMPEIAAGTELTYHSISEEMNLRTKE